MKYKLRKAPIIEFADKQSREALQERALVAIDTHLAGGSSDGL